MTDLEQRAFELEKLAETATPKERLSLQPRIDRVIATLRARGHYVPPRLRRINNDLKQEAFDDMFDNMPV